MSKSLSEQYFVYTGKGYVEVKGKKLTIPGFEDCDLFIHKGTDRTDSGDVIVSKEWTVSEATTGASFVYNWTRRDVIADATERLNRVGVKRFHEVVEKQKKINVSPRHDGDATKVSYWLPVAEVAKAA